MRSQILDGLYLGTVAYAQSLEWENLFDIEVAVNLCQEQIPATEGLTVEWLPVADGEAIPAEVISRALSAIDQWSTHRRGCHRRSHS